MQDVTAGAREHQAVKVRAATRSLGKLGGKTPLVVFLLLALAIGTVGYVVFAHFSKVARQDKYDELTAIGDLKVSQIVGWLDERRGDAAATSKDPILAQGVQRWLERGAPHDEAGRRIESRLQGLREAYGYDAVILLDRSIRPVLVAGDARHQHAHAESNQRAAEAVSAGRPLLSDLHFEAEPDDASAEVNIDVYAPLLEAGDRVVGVVYFRIDPYRFLFPFVQSWPTTSKSAETLLVRRDGDDVLYLNELRHRKDSALRFRLPLNTPDLPAARSLRRETGVIEGVDYRGIPVLAALRTIPGTSWHLVAKIDQAEVFAPARNLAIGVGAMVAVLIAGAGLLVTFWWRKQHAQFLALHFKAELERQALSKHLDLMSRHANDAIFLYDEAGHILEANERAVERYGYARDELIGMSASRLRVPAAASEARAEAQRADEAGSGIYETLHRRKDGGEFPVELSLRVIDLDGRRLTQGIVRDISERKRSELALRESEATYRSLFEHMLNGFAYCRVLFENGQPRDFVYLSVNDAFGTQTGLKNVVGRKVSEVIPGIRESDPGLFEIYGRVALTGQPERFEIFVEALQNWFSISVYSPKREHFVAVFDVITERKRADAALRESEDRYRVIAESASDVILVIDEHSRIEFANPAGENMFGYVRDELIDQPLTILIPEDLRSAHIEGLKRYVNTGRRNVDWKMVELRGRHKNGTQFPVEISFGEFVRDGKRAFAGFVRDITERKQAEHEIQDLNASLERRIAERTQQLEASNKELESFSYSVSHDLRTPLRAIDGFSRTVQEDYAGKLDAEGGRLLGVIRDNSQKMAQLIDDLLKYSRLGRKPLSTGAIDMKRLVEEVLGELQAPGGISHKLALAALPPARGDATLLKQAWTNLLANAIKFSGKREQPVIEVSGHESGVECVYCVKDNGAGFDMRYYEKLFNTFQRLHRDEEFEGTGVGLAIVQRVVSRHGGRVWAEGKVGEGAAFYFSLPKGGGA